MRLKTFGTLEILRDDAPAPHVGLARRPLALLAVMACEGAGGVTRDRLLGLFWPDQEPEKARHSLDQVLYTVRRAISAELVVERPASIHLNSAVLPSDVEEFQAALARGDLEKAVAIYTAPFLDGLYLTEAAGFERWVEEKRAALSHAHVRALTELATAATNAGDYALAVKYARRAAASEPLSSLVARTLMVALCQAGDPSAALNAGRVHAALVHDELDAEADPAVHELIEAIRAGRFTDLARRPRGAASVEEGARAGGAHAPAEQALPTSGATVEPGATARRTMRARHVTIALTVAFAVAFATWVLLASQRRGKLTLAGATATRIYVADLSNDRIVRMDDMDGTNWTALGARGDGAGHFYVPSGLYVDSSGHVYVADRFNNRIVRVDDMAGTNWITLGERGRNTNQFNGPTGVYLDHAGRIYVVDQGNARIVRMDDMAGTHWTAFGTVGNGGGQFNAPAGIFVDRAGKIYVADDKNDRIVRMDDMAGTNWIAFGARGSGLNQLDHPVSVHVDSSGRIYIAEEKNHRIVRIDDMTGKDWTSFGTLGNATGRFFGPDGVFVDAAGRIYTVDAGNNRIVRIEDMTGANWTAYGAGEKGAKPFFRPFAVFVR